MKTGQTIMNYAPQLYKRSIYFKRTNSTVRLWFFIYLFNFFLKMFCQGKSMEGERNGMGGGESQHCYSLYETLPLPTPMLGNV